MRKFILLALFFSGNLLSAPTNLSFCKSQLKDKAPCEILGDKKGPKVIKDWVKNLRKNELKRLQDLEETKKDIENKNNSLADLKKELDVAKAQVVYRMEEFKGLKTQFDNLNVQLNQQTNEYRNLKKNYDDLIRKQRKFTSELSVQNRLTIVAGILFVLALFLLIKKAKESYDSKKEIAVLRAKLKEFSINPEENIEFPIPPKTLKENHLSTPQ